VRQDTSAYGTSFPSSFPPQHQPIQPGIEALMTPRPIFDNPNYKGSGKLKDKVAIITGGDSGIGRAVSLAFAKEGSDIVIVYLYEHEDAEETKNLVEAQGRRCLLIAGDLKKEDFCKKIVDDTIKTFGKLDILVNNAAIQFYKPNLLDITAKQLEDTFRTNIFPLFFVTQAALPYLKPGSSIINTASVTAYRGNKDLIDYSSTKGAIVSFTRALAINLVSQGIRVNGVAPGPVWTPLIPASFDEKKVGNFGTDNKQGRAAQPVELAGAYVFLASQEASFITGTTIHVNGGDMVMS